MAVDDQIAVVGIGVAALLVLGPAIFKVASLRGDANSKWSSRVDLAVVALDEKTVVELRELRDETNTLLPDSGLPFDPAQAIIDPSPLSARVELTAKYYRARVRMVRDLDRVRRLGRVFVMALSSLALCALFLTIYFGDLLDWSWARWAGFATGAFGAVALVAAGIVYVVCVDRLSGAEILAETASQANVGVVR